MAHDEFRGFGSDGESDPDEASSIVGVVERRIDTHHLAVEVHQRTTGIAVIDRRVGLDVIVERRVLDVAMQRADDPRRYRHAETERIADRQHAVAHPEVVAVGPFQHRQRSVDIHLHHREVGHRRDCDQPAVCPIAIVEDHLDVERAGDDVVVGDDDPGWIDDEARAIGLHPARRSAWLFRRKQLPDRDVHHSRHGLRCDHGVSRLDHAWERWSARERHREQSDERRDQQPIHRSPSELSSEPAFRPTRLDETSLHRHGRACPGHRVAAECHDRWPGQARP